MVWLLLRLLACAAATAAVWRWIGPSGIVITAPLWGIALARPILQALSGTRRLARQVMCNEVEGRHFAHRGASFDIIEDVDGFRWLRLADVRKLLPGLPSEGVLHKLYPEDVQPLGRPAVARIRAEALALYLLKASDANALKLRHWLDQEVIFPARTMRDR